MIETMNEEKKAGRLLNEQLRAEINRLDTQEENLLDLAADGGLATDKVKQRLAVIQRKRDQATERLGNSDERLEIGIRLIENALKLLADPQRLYLKFTPGDLREAVCPPGCDRGGDLPTAVRRAPRSEGRRC
jgi:hypothetical protein